MRTFFAYLDAGTGSMILQAVAASAIAVFAFVKGFGYKIKRLFSVKKTKKETNNPAE